MEVERYTHTKQDRIDDRVTGRAFAKEFVKRFGKHFNLEKYCQEHKEHLGHGYETIFTAQEGPISTSNYRSMGQAMIWVTSDIWPIKNVGDPPFQRGFTIHYALRGDYRRKYAKKWHTETEILKFYSFSRGTSEGVLDEFEKFLEKREQFLSQFKPCEKQK